MMAAALDKTRAGIVKKQVAAGKEFKGCPFYSKPDVIHFKVRSNIHLRDSLLHCVLGSGMLYQNKTQCYKVLKVLPYVTFAILADRLITSPLSQPNRPFHIEKN